MIALLVASLGVLAVADDYARGLQLARERQWDAARSAFLAGQKANPEDKRYPLELAGLAFRTGQRSLAKSYLRRALALDPRDPYGNDFLASLYFLDRNTEAALKYWNRAGKPRIGEVFLPETRLDSAVWLRAIPAAPGHVLALEEYETAYRRLKSLDLFSSINLELVARPSGDFDLDVHAAPYRGWLSLASAVRALPFQTLNLDFRNIDGGGLNFTNMLRWDAQKRRVNTALGLPLGTGLRWRLDAFADARSETWNTGAPEDFRLGRIEGGFDVRSVGGRANFGAGVRVASRSFRNAPGLAHGLSAKYRASLDARLASFPERRAVIGADGFWELGRMFAGPGAVFSRGAAGIGATWSPAGFRFRARFGAGASSAATPFDELFMLGLERDNDLFLRAHIGTREGRKGSAPMGRDYFLSNFDAQTDILRAGLFTLSAGPFLDTGRVFAPFRPFVSETLVDAGAQLEIRVLGVRMILSYGRDLRAGRNAWYARSGP